MSSKVFLKMIFLNLILLCLDIIFNFTGLLCFSILCFYGFCSECMYVCLCACVSCDLSLLLFCFYSIFPIYFLKRGMMMCSWVGGEGENIWEEMREDVEHSFTLCEYILL